MEIEKAVMQINEIITNTIKHLQESKPTYSSKQTKPKTTQRDNRNNEHTQ